MKLHCWVGIGVIVLAATVTGMAALPRVPAAGAPAAPEEDWSFLQEEPAEEEPKGPAKHKIEGTLEIEQHDGRWRFIVKGTTDLPDGTQLKARVHVIERTVSPKGKMTLEDEQISSRRDGWPRRFEVSKGAFEAVAYDWPRRPFSLEYQARITFERSTQKDIGEENFEVRFSRPAAGAAVLDDEFRAAAKEISSDLEKVLVQFGELKKAFAEQQKAPAKEAWLEWKKSWLARVEVVDERNAERWELWAAWIERQGRFRIEGLCDMLRRLLQLCDSALEGAPEALAGAPGEFQAFMKIFQDARDIVGIDAPFDLVEVAEQIDRYSKAVTAMRVVSELKDPDRTETWIRVGPSAIAKAKTALMKLGDPKLIPRRGYDQILVLTDAFLELLPLLEKASTGKAGDPERAELAKLLADHDQKLRAFREYAGIK